MIGTGLASKAEQQETVPHHHYLKDLQDFLQKKMNQWSRIE